MLVTVITTAVVTLLATRCCSPSQPQLPTYALTTPMPTMPTMLHGICRRPLALQNLSPEDIRVAAAFAATPSGATVLADATGLRTDEIRAWASITSQLHGDRVVSTP